MRAPPRFTLTDTLFPYTALVRSKHRPDEPGGILPQLPLQVVPGRRRGEGLGLGLRRRPRDCLRDALRRVEGEAPDRGDARAECGLRGNPQARVRLSTPMALPACPGGAASRQAVGFRLCQLLGLPFLHVPLPRPLTFPDPGFLLLFGLRPT